MPVLFATDGQILDSLYFGGIDSLIARKKVRPFVFVAAFSDETFLPDRGCEIRNFEYVDGLYGGKDSLNQLFERHLNFFCIELPDSINKKLNLDLFHRRNAFFGFSNGADFGLSTVYYHPDLFDDYILYSPMQGSHIVESLGQTSMKFFLSCGTEETVALENIRKLRSFLKRRKIDVHAGKWRGGHERKQWRNQFLSDIQTVFPAGQ